MAAGLFEPSSDVQGLSPPFFCQAVGFRSRRAVIFSGTRSSLYMQSDALVSSGRGENAGRVAFVFSLAFEDVDIGDYLQTCLDSRIGISPSCFYA